MSDEDDVRHALRWLGRVAEQHQPGLTGASAIHARKVLELIEGVVPATAETAHSRAEVAMGLAEVRRIRERLENIENILSAHFRDV